MWDEMEKIKNMEKEKTLKMDFIINSCRARNDWKFIATNINLIDFECKHFILFIAT